MRRLGLEARLEDRDELRVLEPGEDPRLTAEVLDERLDLRELDRDELPALRVAGLPHHGEAPRACLLEELVLPDEHPPDEVHAITVLAPGSFVEVGPTRFLPP